jgi:hypothetical protein
LIDIEGNLEDFNVKKALNELKSICENISEANLPEVPWFPTKI